MLERNNNKYYDKICNSILEDVACIVEIDNENRTYHVSEWDECLKSVLKPEGSLRDLYRVFFSGHEQQSQNKQNDYDRFIDEEVFMKEKYQGGIRFKMKGEEKTIIFVF